MRTTQRNKTISKSTALRKENPLPHFKVASYKCLEIRLSFEDPTTLLSGGGGREESVGYEVQKKCPPQVCNFLNSFVQDCIQGDSRFLARILTWTKREPTNKKHFTEAVLSTKFHDTPSSHRKVRPHIVTCFRVVQTWQAWKVWKVIYSFQKSQNKTWMTFFLEEKKFVVFIQ